MFSLQLKDRTLRVWRGWKENASPGKSAFMSVTVLNYKIKFPVSLKILRFFFSCIF